MLQLLWPTCRIFSEPEPWAYKQSTPFSLFKTFRNFTVASSVSVFASPCRTFFRTSAVGPQAIDAFCSLFPVFRRILSTVFTFRIVPSVRSGGFCSQHPRGHADRSGSSSEKHGLRPPRFRHLGKSFVWAPPAHILGWFNQPSFLKVGSANLYRLARTFLWCSEFVLYDVPQCPP